jgi:DNA-binding NarL/FixJ family response regulator
MPAKPIRLVIVEDQELLAETLAAIVNKLVDFSLVGCARDGEEGWKLCLSTRPALALLDIEMPKLDGLGLARRLLKENWPIRVIAMSGLTDPYTIWRVRQSGVHGYIEKTQGAESLLNAIRTVAAGGTYFSDTFERVKQQWVAQPEAFYKVLSDREQHVLQRVVVGWDDQRIGTQLGISRATVAVHRKNIRRKLELHNDRDLVAYARQWGLDRGVGC